MKPHGRAEALLYREMGWNFRLMCTTDIAAHLELKAAMYVLTEMKYL